MKNLLIICFMSVIYAFPGWAQTGKPFPTLTGTTLESKNVTLPNDTKGKFTLLGMAYSKSAEQELQTWYQPVFSTFIKKGKPGLFSQSYDVNLYFIPMFTGINQAATESAKKKMREGMDKALIPYVLIYKGELNTYKQQLDFEKKDTPYFFVLDAEGKVAYATSGKFTDEKLEKIEAILEPQE